MSDIRDQVAVRIFGREYHLTRDPDKTVDHIREVAALVDEKMLLITQEHGAQSGFHSALLAGLDLIDELFRLRDEYDSAQSDISGRTSRLSESLGRRLEGGSIERASADTGVAGDRSSQPISNPADSSHSPGSSDADRR